MLRAYDAVTGVQSWSTTLPVQYMFTAPPTAVNGTVYVGGAGSGGTLYAVNETTGQLIWSASVANGDQSSPSVSADGVFVSYPCQVYKFDPRTRSSIWHNNTGCSGGGGKTTVFANGSRYVRDSMTNPVGSILNTASGTASGSFGSTAMMPIPALSTTNGYFLVGGTLKNGDLTSLNSTWSFTGDGSLITAPIVVNSSVFIGSSTGMVYSLNSATGVVLWSASAGAAIAGPDEQNVSAPLVGLSAGEGFLLVPAGSKIVAWRLIP